MPGRKVKIVTDNFYHVFNRGVAKMPTFLNNQDFRRFLAEVNYYRFANLPSRYSWYMGLRASEQLNVMQVLKTADQRMVDIISFVLMPNHFHFLLKQNVENGISLFIGRLTNSYTKYFNTRHNRVGPLFQGRFKAVAIESDELLLHVHRYHHLNPFSDNLVDSFEDLLKYEYSSLPCYLGQIDNEFVDSKLVSGFFKTKHSYIIFIKSQSDYQRNLASIKKLLLE